VGRKGGRRSFVPSPGTLRGDLSCALEWCERSVWEGKGRRHLVVFKVICDTHVVYMDIHVYCTHIRLQ